MSVMNKDPFPWEWGGGGGGRRDHFMLGIVE